MSETQTPVKEMPFELSIHEGLTSLGADGGVVAVAGVLKDPADSMQLMSFLSSKEATDFALQYAAQKVANPRITGLGQSPRPLNGDGEPMKAPEIIRGQEAFGYVIECPILRG